MSESENTQRVQVSGVPQDLLDEVDGKLGYGDSRSAWIREAMRQRLDNQRIAQSD